MYPPFRRGPICYLNYEFEPPMVSGLLIRSPAVPRAPFGRVESSQTKAPLLNRSYVLDSVKLIRNSPLGRSKSGKEIIAKILALNLKRKIVRGGEVEGSRASWSPSDQTIFLPADLFLQPNCYGVALELIHEAAHALWKNKKHTSNQQLHPIPELIPVGIEASTSKITDPAKIASMRDHLKDEFNAMLIQLDFYEYLKANFNHTDVDLERRLELDQKGYFEAGLVEDFYKPFRADPQSKSMGRPEKTYIKPAPRKVPIEILPPTIRTRKPPEEHEPGKVYIRPPL
jgi:hypothetical protein